MRSRARRATGDARRRDLARGRPARSRARPGASSRSVKPTHLLHLAWYVVPGKLITAPENFAWVAASFDLVRRFAEPGGQRVAVCGSGYEYDWRYGYCSEELTPCVPDTVYGACKQALHEMVRSFAAGQGLSAAWGRVFFLYGPNEHPQRLVSSVIRSLLEGEPAPCSHGRQIRDYLHVQDVADGLVALLDSDVAGRRQRLLAARPPRFGDIVLTHRPADRAPRPDPARRPPGARQRRAAGGRRQRAGSSATRLEAPLRPRVGPARRRSTGGGNRTRTEQADDATMKKICVLGTGMAGCGAAHRAAAGRA